MQGQARDDGFPQVEQRQEERAQLARAEARPHAQDQPCAPLADGLQDEAPREVTVRRPVRVVQESRHQVLDMRVGVKHPGTF